MNMSIIAASRLRERPIFPNTFFGGIGDVVTDEASLATQIDNTGSLNGSDIKLFEIDSNDNIRCNIQKPYSSGDENYKSDNTTFYYDFDGNIIDFEQRFFGTNSPLERVISLSSGNLISQCFRLTQLTHAILPNISGSLSRGHFAQQRGDLKRVYLPNWEDFSTEDALFGAAFSSSALNSVWYFKANMETVDNGSPHPSILFTTGQGNIEARYVQNTDKPNPVTDLSISNVTANSAQLDFTPPAVNTNANDFYYVYLDWNGISFKFAYNTAQEISAFYDEITGSGDTITGLPSGTEISVQIQTVDFYHNVSNYSNKVTFTTL